MTTDNIEMEKEIFASDIRKVICDFAVSLVNNEFNVNVILINEV